MASNLDRIPHFVSPSNLYLSDISVYITPFDEDTLQRDKTCIISVVDDIEEFRPLGVTTYNSDDVVIPLPYHRIKPSKLDLVAEIITTALYAYDNVIVHCVDGIDRSPLAIAWFMEGINLGTASKERTLVALPHAYAIIRKIRPVVIDRSDWVDWSEEEL